MKNNMEIQKFDPTKTEIEAAVLEVKDLKISGVNDEVGYAAVKAGKKKLADYRIAITKFGKRQREEALAWQREVLRQEKELIAMIEPTESKLKSELGAVDEEKKKQERLILIPGRRNLLSEIGKTMTDDEIVAMDEKEFSEFYTKEKLDFLEKQEQERKEKEAEARRAEEIEQAKKEAAEKAKIEERERIEREQAEKERKEKEEQERKEKEEADRIEAERVEQEKAEKNRKYKKWLKDNGYSDETKSEFHIIREENTFTLYKKISSITI